MDTSIQAMYIEKTLLPTLAKLKKQTETVHWDTFMEKKWKKK
jgi:hypothetical protein